MTNGQWLDDPYRRYLKRWYDGTGWTMYVTNDGPPQIDPLGTGPFTPGPGGTGNPAWGPGPGYQSVSVPGPAGYPVQGAPQYFVHTPVTTNGLAIASLVLGLLWLWWIGSILAVIFGHIALVQIKRKGESGSGMAIAGLVLGYIGVAVLAIAIIAVASSSGS